MKLFPRLLPLSLSVIVLLISCRGSNDDTAPVGGGILTPLLESSTDESGNGAGTSLEEQAVLPLVNPGSNYNILILLDGNLDLEQSDEQVIVAIPLDDLDAPLQLMIASTNPILNEYSVVWSRALGYRNLSGVSLRADDLTGNSRNDLVISGFNELGDHVTEIFAVPRKGEIKDFTRVFSLAVDGNIDIITHERSPGYWSGLSTGKAYNIVVQESDPDNAMDILETDWKWSSGTFSFIQGDTRHVKAEAIQGERIAKVYAGGVEPYEEYLSGAWYRETGSGASTVMLFFNPGNREVMFYDGSIQEVFSWGKSHRTTTKRLYSRIVNTVIPSMFDNLRISAEDWDTLELSRTAEAWNGTYKRLGEGLQVAVDGGSFPTLITELPLTGVWKSSTGGELVFDIPGIEWREDGESRIGSSSLFSINDVHVLQVRFMKNNGAWEETLNWQLDYTEEGSESRIIRSISLTPISLSSTGIRSIGEAPLYFEQIEIVSGQGE